MSKKGSDAVTVEKHIDQIRAMLEEAEVDFDEGSNGGGTQYIDIPDAIAFVFDDAGILTGVDHD